MTTGSQQSGGWWPAEDEAATSWLPERELPPLNPETAGPPTNNARPARLALGLAILAAERLRATARPPAEQEGATAGSTAAADRPRNAGPSAAFETGVGLLQQTAAEAREVARRAMDRPARLASRAATWASRLPGANVPRRSLWRSRERIDRMVAEARDRGAAAVAESRADATAFVQTTVNDAIAWAQVQAIPQIVDGLVPHMVDSVVPRIIDGAMPEIRSRVLPVLIDDLTNDPQVRELVVEQGRGVVGEAAEHLRSTTSSADDRVESAFRRLVRRSDDQPSDVDSDQSTPPAA